MGYSFESSHSILLCNRKSERESFFLMLRMKEVGEGERETNVFYF